MHIDFLFPLSSQRCVEAARGPLRFGVTAVAKHAPPQILR